MSINLSGTLTVQVIQGRRGPFKTAKLATSIGTFDVKNPILKQFEPGEYQGNFIIEQLKVKAYEWGGGATSYLDAALDWQHLAEFAQEFSSESDSPQDDPSDPFDPVPENGIRLPEYAETADQVGEMIAQNREHISLGEYILSDRDELNIARSMMKEAGYSYRSQSQTWCLQ
ncbi:TPA: DUF3275 family protein [Neisseria gonorrhoeae]